MHSWRHFLKENGFFVAVFVLLVLFPHGVGWLTESSPLGVLRGDRYIMRGESTLWQAILIESFALSVLVMSYNLMFGFTGVISFGHAMFFGLGGYIVGMLLEFPEFAGIDPALRLLLGLLLTVFACGAIGLGIGFASLRLRGVYFAIFTLAVAEMVWIYFSRFDRTNGEDGLTISQIPTWIDPSQNRLALYYISLAIFVLTFVFIRRLVNSPTGAVFKAIRENEERAQAIGYHTLRFKLMAITIAGILAGIAGIIHAILQKSARPEFLNVKFTVDALLMTIIGGVGTFTGPVIGSTGLYLLDNQLRDQVVTIGSAVIDIGDSWNLILGFIFVMVVLIFPYGVVGTYQRWRAERKNKSL